MFNKNKKILSLIENFSELIILFDKEKRVVFYNEKIINLFQINCSTLKESILKDQNNVNIIEYLFKETINTTHKFKLLNGQIISCVLKKINIKKYKYILLIEDITSYQNEISQLNSRLDEVNNVVKEKTQFLSRTSHEIRTPLNGIIGMNEIAIEALKNNDYEKCAESLYKVEYSSKYLLSIVENVLDMSRFEVGKFVVENAECNFNNLLKEVNCIVSTQANNKNQKLTFNKIDDIKLLCDATKLKQILVNIIGNSIKYTDESGKIDIYTNVSLINDKYEVKIQIKDNGIGMSKAFLQHIFEPFAQENKNSVIKGTGLGLAITKNLVNLLNGDIKYESVEGLGTTCFLTFIFDKIIEIQTLDKEQVKTIDYSRYRILVAEDNEINQMVIKRHLEYYNFKIDIVSDGDEAVEAYNNNPLNYYDLILMDIHMPNTDGIEATKIIRSSTRSDADVAIIALSADTLKSDIEKFLISGIDNHISKPVIREKMINIIYETLNKKHKI